MIAKVSSGAIRGVDGYIITVEVDVSQGLPTFEIVGLPDSAVKESKERVRIAIKNSGAVLPPKRITINLAPADIRKEGPAFDLPIAIGLLAGLELVPIEKLKNTFIVGELSLDGLVRPVNGVLPMVYGALQNGITECIVPKENSVEAALVEGVTVIGISHLSELIDYLKGTTIEPTTVDIDKFFGTSTFAQGLDFFDVKGQENVKRALEICAAGGHNMLMIGPPGSGKTMMAKRFPTILPDLTFSESLEITKIYSVAGLLKDKSCLVTERPFRSPHHTTSSQAIAGGGRIPKPGEISLAHRGVLFLDELPEFYRNVLEAMRQPLEDGIVTIPRVSGTVTYPSDFMLIAAMNPCPCGYNGEPSKCTCSQREIDKYRAKISGPLLDRIDIQVEASSVKYSDFNSSIKVDSSSEIKSRVLKVQKIQSERYREDKILFNAQLSAVQIEKYCSLGKEENKVLKQAFNALRLSARAYHRILKVSRTIADLENSEKILVNHLAEAIQYRSLDRS